MYLAFRRGYDPFRLYHGLDRNGMRRAPDGGEEGPVRPKDPARYKALVYAFSVIAMEDDTAMAGAKLSTQSGGLG